MSRKKNVEETENVKNAGDITPETAPEGTAKQAELKEPDVIEEAAEESASDEIAVLKEQLLRQAAEYDNYRKRTAKERVELVPDITARIVTEFLPVIDNIERALQAECSDDIFKKGIEMIYDSFKNTLNSLGVEEITEEDFDPALHQAVQQTESGELPPGKVAQTFQKGYKIGGKVIRFAMVAITK